MIRLATTADAASICAIYDHYVRNTAISFEEESVGADEMAHRVETYSKDYPWLVYETDEGILGYCYATKWRARAAYRHSAETSVYVHKDCGRRGVGTALYGELIPRVRALGAHALVAGITLPNVASVALHEKFGFEKVAQFREIGKKFGQWHDVGYWEKTL